MAEPITTGVILGLVTYRAGKIAGNVAEDFLKRVLAPVGDALGEAAAHPIREWQAERVRRGKQMVETAAGLLDAAGHEAKAVPGRVLWPTLEKGSMEDSDPDLQRKWANLLANAADATNDGELPASFPHILAELSPLDVKVLDFMLANGDSSGTYPCDEEVVAAALKRERHDVHISVSNLMRQNLVSMPLGRIPYVNQGHESETEYRETVYLTDLGFYFVNACRYPS